MQWLRLHCGHQVSPCLVGLPGVCVKQATWQFWGQHPPAALSSQCLQCHDLYSCCLELCLAPTLTFCTASSVMFPADS
jgi:hypothetical protein